MSTQNEAFSPLSFSINQPFTNIRLLELPPDLLDVVLGTSNQDGDICLISSPASNSSTENAIKEGFLHICTNEMMWAVKQVSTSNSVYVSQMQSRSQRVDSCQEETSTEAVDLTAIAKATSILELYQVQPSVYNNTISEDIQRLVPQLNFEGDETFSTSDNPTSMAYSELYKQIPGPRQAVSLALAQACVIESTPPDRGHSTATQVFKPSLELLLQTWRRINEAAATSNDVDLSSAKAVYSALEDYETISGSDHVRSQHLAVAKCMLVSCPDTSVHSPVSMFNALKLTKVGQQDVLNAMEVTRWIGNLYLNVVRLRGTEFLDVTAFIKEWDDLVPAQWVKYCSVEVLDNACGLSSGTEEGQQTVKWKPFVLSTVNTAACVGSSETKIQATSSTAGSKNKRKWHERFAAQRDAKK